MGARAVSDPEIPEVPPLFMGAITIMRCTTCGAVVPGNWQVSRKTRRAGIDHIFDRHGAELIAGQLRPPAFVNCAVYDPFWLEEQADQEADHA